MKAYRLKKWYPSLPKDWEEGMEVGQGDRGSHADYSPCAGNYTDKRIPVSQVECCDGFWEEVVEKDYEVLSYTTNVVETGSDWVVESKISSVKRLSDEAVFSVGDSVVVPKQTKDFYKYSDYTIKSFKVWPEYYKHNKLMAIVENGCHIPLDELKHYKKEPIFTTEDGKDIFEGDEYWCVHSYDFFLRDYIAETGIYNKNYKRFSTKEAAEEYIRNNKPMYTLKDIEKCVENWGLCKVEGEHIERFLDKRTL